MYGENDSAVVESCIASELGSGVVLLGLCDNVVDELSPHARLFFCGVVSCLERFACDLRLCTWGLARLTRGLARFLTADDKRKSVCPLSSPLARKGACRRVSVLRPCRST